jgi:hypothetical protein
MDLLVNMLNIKGLGSGVLMAFKGETLIRQTRQVYVPGAGAEKLRQRTKEESSPC